MIWNIIRVIMSFGMDTFYKRLSIKNRKYVATKGPAIIAINHPNAFMDPVMFTYVAYPPKFYFLARGDVFKPGIASYIFEGLGIAPIFRIQDGGREGLKKNDDTYRRVYKLLEKNKKVIIFAEGLCVQERRLRPLKKGVPRMVFNAMEEINNPDLCVVPVGVNYTNPKKFRSNLFFNVGEPIRVADYMSEYKAQPARAMNNFLKMLEPRMKELIVHINDPKNDKLVGWMEEMFLRDWCKKRKWNYKNLDHEFRMSQHITAMINEADENRKEKVEDLKEACKIYFRDLDKLKIRDWLIDPHSRSKVNWFQLLVRVIMLVVFSPLCLRGIIGNYLPYKASQKITDKMVKHVEFHSSFNMGIGTLLLWIFYIIQFAVVYNLFNNIGWASLVVINSFVTGKFVLYYYPYLKKTMGILRTLTNKQKIKELKAKRHTICDMVAEINKN